MNPLIILQILQGVLGAAPQLLDLFHRASSGQPVTADEVKAVLAQYDLDHAALVAAIGAAEKPATPGA